ncbi:hypothetical protein [Sphingosinithalassobacter sp. LHW66-3]|uniref:hypothetical protein n=1 Tax=Sphingosinithalassobacter sp. LHW66-3 TaxID=3424718 RepID=UPI003D6AE213
MNEGASGATATGFVLPEGAREFFDYSAQKLFGKFSRSAGEQRDMIMFDAFWASLVVGLLARKQGDAESLKGDRFLAAYPDDYEPFAEYIAGLLVEAELATLHTEDYTERQLERAISRLLKVSAPTRLSPDGLKLLNLYAAGGFKILADRMRPRPSDASSFMQRYEALLAELSDV